MTAGSVLASVRERPVLFSGPMVRAILDGKKSQTRRVVTKGTSTSGPRWESLDWSRCHVDPGLGGGQYLKVGGPDDTMHRVRCKLGEIGDRLWIRETYLAMAIDGGPVRDVMYSDHEDYDICYPSKSDKMDLGWRVVPSIHMPRWASRLTLEITEVRVERLGMISDADAAAEGFRCEHGFDYCTRGCGSPAVRFMAGDFAKALSPDSWVWVIGFRRMDGSTPAAPSRGSANKKVNHRRQSGGAR